MCTAASCQQVWILTRKELTETMNRPLRMSTTIPELKPDIEEDLKMSRGATHLRQVNISEMPSTSNVFRCKAARREENDHVVHTRHCFTHPLS